MATSVHWQQPGLLAMSETDGHGDTCGPIAILDYLHFLDPQKWPLDVQSVDTIRAECIAWGLMNTPQYRGMTISSIAAALRTYYHVAPVKVVPWSDPASFDFAAYRADLIAALSAHQPVITETSRAYALPDNQPGVEFHFILHGGIDSTLGYWTCNGDTLTALAHPGAAVSPVWYSRGDLQASMPGGYLILPALPVPFTPDVPAAIALLHQALGKLEAA